MTEANSTTENVTHTPLTASDIDQIVDGLDNFCIGPVENDELRAIWQPYIDKLQAHRALLVAAPQLLDVAREFVAMYDGLRDSVGASVSERLARAEAAIAKATIAVLAVLLIASSAQAQEQPVLPGSVTLTQLESVVFVGPWHRIYAPNKTADRLTWALNIADGLSTLHARIALGDRFVERNGLMGNVYRFIAIKGAIAVSANRLSHRMRSNDHRVLANVVQLGGAFAAGSFALLNERTIHNARQIR